MFVTGVSQSYDETCYDKQILGGYITEDQFRYCITKGNKALESYWPCDVAY